MGKVEAMVFSDDAREKLRLALEAHRDEFGLSPQQIADEIVNKTGFELPFDGGRKRVERFLKNKNKPAANFLAAVAEYLASMPPPTIEESAAAMVDFFGGTPHRIGDSNELVGRYEVCLRRPDAQDISKDTGAQVTVLNGYEFKAAPPPEKVFPITYGDIEIKMMDKKQAQYIAERITNPFILPDSEQPADAHPDEAGVGIIISFGNSLQGYTRYLIMAKSRIATRLYHLVKVKDYPLVLRGQLQIDSRLGAESSYWQADPLAPDYEVQLTKRYDI